jgi:DNA helicase II / ATP-dependent DNA helicase PcrA
LPLVRAKQTGNEFAVAAIIRKSSPLLSKEALLSSGTQQIDRLKYISAAIEELVGLFASGATPSFLDVLQCVVKNNLFEVPDSSQPFIAQVSGDVADNDEDTGSERLAALRQFLESPFHQIERYSRYVKGEAPFGTHQGVKGLEFPRVLVILDDEDAGGFLFSYEKLFGAKSKSETDLKNEQSGSETGIDRTRRLFYVTCSRSEKSLGIVAYSSNPEGVKRHVISQGWFNENEIELVEPQR